METININIAVDVMRALCEGTLDGNARLMDDSTSGSEGQGTSGLKTACRPGDLVRWKVYPIDLQAGAAISSITFGGTPVAESGQGQSGTPLYLNTWEGIVPYLPEGEYPYRLTLQIGKGENSVMTLDTLSLLVRQEAVATGTETEWPDINNNGHHEQTDYHTCND